MLWVPQESVFISTQFFILNLGGRFGVLSKFSFYFLVFHCYITTSSTILSFFSGDLSLGISLTCSIISASFVTVSELFCGEILRSLVILSAIFLPIKSPLVSAVFGVFAFGAVLRATLVDYLAWWRLRLYLLFSLIFLLIFLAKVKHPLSILFLCLIE